MILHPSSPWYVRITQVVESLYGQDLGLGPPRLRIPSAALPAGAWLEAHLAGAAQDARSGQVHLRHKTDEETVYSEHKWNINNMPRCKVRHSGQPIVPPLGPLLHVTTESLHIVGQIRRANAVSYMLGIQPGGTLHAGHCLEGLSASAIAENGPS